MRGCPYSFVKGVKSLEVAAAARARVSFRLRAVAGIDESEKPMPAELRKGKK